MVAHSATRNSLVSALQQTQTYRNIALTNRLFCRALPACLPVCSCSDPHHRNLVPSRVPTMAYGEGPS
jgi:hypothetical protein